MSKIAKLLACYSIFQVLSGSIETTWEQSKLIKTLQRQGRFQGCHALHKFIANYPMFTALQMMFLLMICYWTAVESPMYKILPIWIFTTPLMWSQSLMDIRWAIISIHQVCNSHSPWITTIHKHYQPRQWFVWMFWTTLCAHDLPFSFGSSSVSAIHFYVFSFLSW